MFYPHTCPHTSLFRQEALCLPGILWMGVRFNGQDAEKQRFTGSIAMLNLWYSYAEPLVPGCFTILVLLFQFVYRQYQGEFFSNPRQNSRKTDANPKQKQEFPTSNPKQHAYIYPLNAWAGNISLTLAENCAILNVFSRSM